MSVDINRDIHRTGSDMQAISLSKTSAGLDRLGTAIMPGAPRHHGIVVNPKTRQRVDREIGEVRHVRIDLRGHRRADADMQGAEVMLALRILYDDIAPAAEQVIAKRVGARTLPPRLVPAASDPTIRSFVRPVAARIEERAVSIWAEVDKETAWAYEKSGRQSFGPPLSSEPEIRRDAVVIKGADLDVLSNEAIAEIADRQERHRADVLRQRSTRRRKMTLAGAVMALIAIICLGGTLMGSLMIPVMLASLLVMELALSPSGERLAAAWRDSLRDMRSGRRRIVTSEPVQEAGSQILEAIGLHAPVSAVAAEEAVARIRRLRVLVDGSTDPWAHSEIASVEGDLRATMQAYARPARIAVGDECRALATDLAAATIQIGQRAESVRRRLLDAARDGFDTQRRYLASKDDEGLLAPVA